MMTAVEKESAHRREIEAKVVDAHIRHDDKQFTEARVGQIFAFLITLSAIGAGVWTATTGHEIAGSVIGIGGIGGIVATFLGRPRPNKDDREEPPASKTSPKNERKNNNSGNRDSRRK
jgi:uncharacterized membrane protein